MFQINKLRKDTYDKVFNNISSEYYNYVPEELDEKLTNLVNLLEEYLVHQTRLDEIKSIMKDLPSISFLDKEITPKLIDFNDNSETNMRLSIMLPKIAKLRMQVFKIAYNICQDIIEEKITDAKVHENFHLALGILYNNPIENFYADLTIYLSDYHLDRFYNELELYNIVSSILDGKEISEEVISQLEYKLDKSHKKEIEYIKKRFIPKTKQLERGKNND